MVQPCWPGRCAPALSTRAMLNSVRLWIWAPARGQHFGRERIARAGCRDDAHARSVQRTNAVARVFHADGIFGVHAEAFQHAQVDVGRRLAVLDFVAVQGHGQDIVQPGGAQDVLAQGARRAAGQRHAVMRGRRAHGLHGTFARRQVRCVQGLHARDDLLRHAGFVHARVRLQLQALHHDACPRRRVAAHRRHLVLGGPDAPDAGGKLGARTQPEVLGLHEHTVHVEHDGLDPVHVAPSGSGRPARRQKAGRSDRSSRTAAAPSKCWPRV